MIKRFIFFVLFCVGASSVRAAENPLPGDGETWNAAVDAYRAGDSTNALNLLRPLLQSSTHAARAAEVVAKLEYEAAHRLGETNTLEHLEAAASAAQIALRANPGDARANDNFTRAIDGLAELRETKRVNDILASAEGKDPSVRLKAALKDVREVMKDSRALEALPAAERVERSDRLEAKARSLVDVWPPLRELVAKSVTNEQEAAAITAKIDEARDRTAETAKLVGDLQAGSSLAAEQAEEFFSGFHKALVPPPQAIAESLLSQSNAVANVEAIGSRSWQADAVDYTRAFRARFPQWADQYEQSRAMNTNAPPLTAEMRAKIEELAEQLETEQLACCQEKDPARQRKALDLSREICALIPHDPQQPPPQNQQQNQDQQQQQDRQQSNQDQDQNQDQAQEQQQSQPQSGERKDEQQEQEAREAKEEEKSPEEKEDAALLQRIMERSAEHKADQQKRAGRRRVIKDW